MKKRKLKRKIAKYLNIAQSDIDSIRKQNDGFIVDFQDEVEDVYNEGTKWEHKEKHVEFYEKFYISCKSLSR